MVNVIRMSYTISRPTSQQARELGERLQAAGVKLLDYGSGTVPPVFAQAERGSFVEVCCVTAYTDGAADLADCASRAAWHEKVMRIAGEVE